MGNIKHWTEELQNIPCKKVHSQRGQDGIIEFIFQNISTTNKFCVEFGFNSKSLEGGSGANTANLILNNGWGGILFDGGFENSSINLHKEMLSFDNIGDVFRKHSVPQEPDYVSIDVDSIDLWLLKGMLLAGYRPRLVSVEYNANFPLTVSATVKQGTRWTNTDAVYGASLSALNMVAKEFDYHLICVEECLDAFFIRGDLSSISPGMSCFAKFTGIKIHRTPNKRKMSSFVEYPSLTPFTETDAESLFCARQTGWK
jgi:hypothetical protein